MAISNTELNRRVKMMRSGEYDQTWITLENGNEFFAKFTWPTPHIGLFTMMIRTANDTVKVVNLGDIVKAVH